MTVGRTLRAALDEALSLVVPVDCVGCDAPGWTLCPACRARLAARPEHRDVRGLQVWSGLAFDGVAARALRALKAEGRTALAAELAPLLLAAVACHDESGAVLVPVPTSPAAMRRRGYRVTELLARRAGLGIRPLLVPARRIADQRSLDAAGRARNVAGGLRARPAAAGTRVIVVDDVVTTGATLDEARRALTDAGADVVGAATALATPRRGGGGMHTQFPRDTAHGRG